MAITVTAEQRDALYGEVMVRLSGIDVVFRAASAGDFVLAQERAREYVDLLLLVLNDLGWGDRGNDRGLIELTTSPEVVRRGLSYILGSASNQLGLEEREQVEHRAEMTGVQSVVSACVDLLRQLDGSQEGSQ